MEFTEFKKVFQTQFDNMVKNNDALFLTDVDKDAMWETYLTSFPEGTNKIYKEKREYDCNCCRHFIRSYGNVVVIRGTTLVSIWDDNDAASPFKEVSSAMSAFVKASPIKNAFVSNLAKIGTDKSRQLIEKEVIIYEHLYYELPKSYVYTGSESIEAIQGQIRNNKNVFRRAMDELTLEAGHIILELIEQNSLYRGTEFKSAIVNFISYKKKYDVLSAAQKDNWCWSNASNNPISRIRNTAIGTLLVDLSENVDVDVAVTKFEKVMAPTNYKRPKAIFTKKMIEDAQSTLETLGLSNSLQRRFAKIEDITVNNILFVNRDARKKLKNSVFDDLKEDVIINPKKFDKVEEVTIDEFIRSILPNCTSIELMPESKHIGNFVSLIAPEDTTVPTMFKWSNNFSWAYNGDIADSIKQNVKAAGGNVEGVLRFSIQWNTDNHNPNDFDAHCIEPNNNEIFFRNKVNRATTGNLDIDITQPTRGIPAVENITWTNKTAMLEGKYQFLVHNWAHRGGKSGFSAEIEYEGQIYTYEYDKELKPEEKVIVAEINFSKKNGITFLSSLDSTMSSKEVWGVHTNKFSKVNVCMFSPNYWDNQDAIGNRHYFFFLDDCTNATTPRGFFNEFLNEQLTPHRKVFEALGSKMRVADTSNQLSGLGFSTTQKNSILAKVEGALTRTLKITF